MKTAEEWHDEYFAKDKRTGHTLIELISAIQADALRAAAESVSTIGKDGRQWVPNSLWDNLAKEHAAIILSLIPEAKP